MRAKDFLSEIDYTSSLSGLNIDQSLLIANSDIVGEIDGSDVHRFVLDNQSCYFFINHNKISAMIIIMDGRLRAVRNFSGTPGYVTALVAFYTHELGNKLLIDKSEQFSPSSIKWLCSLIRAGGRGLRLTDQTGNYPNAELLYKEWETTMRSSSHGPTSIIIESAITRRLYKRSDLLMIPTQWISEEYNLYETLARNNTL